MNITMKYRRVGLTQKQHLLNCVNPSPLIKRNGLRMFFADTDVVGTTDIDALCIIIIGGDSETIP